MNKIEIDLDAITEQMDNLRDTKARLNFELKRADEQIEKLELQFIALLSQKNVKKMEYGAYSFGLKEVKRKALDQKFLKEKYPDVYNSCYLEKTSEKFEFKINK